MAYFKRLLYSNISLFTCINFKILFQLCRLVPVSLVLFQPKWTELGTIVGAFVMSTISLVMLIAMAVAWSWDSARHQVSKIAVGLMYTTDNFILFFFLILVFC